MEKQSSLVESYTKAKETYTTNSMSIEDAAVQTALGRIEAILNTYTGSQSRVEIDLMCVPNLSRAAFERVSSKLKEVGIPHKHSYVKTTFVSIVVVDILLNP